MKTAMIWCLGILMVSQSFAVDPRSYYVQLMPERVGDQVKLHFEPMLFSGSGKPIDDIFLSQVLQDAVIHMKLNEAKGEGRPTTAFRIPFHLQMRTLDGEVVETLRHFVTLGLSAPGFFRVGLEERHTDFRFSQLESPAFYPQIFRAMMQGFEGKLLPVPDQDRFVIELYYGFPHGVNRFVSQDFPHRQDYMDVDGHLQLGVAWCKQSAQGFQVVNLGHLLQFEKHKLHLQASRDAGLKKDLHTAMVELEQYFEAVPSSKRVAHVLADLYRAHDEEKALAFMGDYQPYFGNFFQTAPKDVAGFINSQNVGKKESVYAARLRRGRAIISNNRVKGQYRKLLKNRDQSVQSDQHQVWISNPVQNDLVAGEILVEAVAWTGDESIGMLVAECYVENQLVDKIPSLPLRFRAQVARDVEQTIRVRVYFNDETYAEGEVSVQGLPIDEEERVPASRLQVVGSRRGETLRLNEDNLVVIEDGETIQPNRVRQDQEPLDLVILIDTSGTMGHRLSLVQTAVYNLLKKLKPGEAASIYTFDQKVTLLARYEGDLEAVEPYLFTLSGYGTTSVNDAVLVAKTRLMSSDKATKAVILIGDGADTSSITGTSAVLSMLQGSPLRIYSIDVGEGHKNLSLDRFAEITGGSYKHVDNNRDFSPDLYKILDELRSLYFVTYQGQKSEPKSVRAEHRGRKLSTLRVTL